MRKFLSVILLLSMLITVSVCAEESDADTITYDDVFNVITKHIDEGEYVSRGECIISIMKLVGLIEEIAEDQYGTTFYAPPFADYEDVDDYVYGYAISARQCGILKGYSKGNSYRVTYIMSEKDVTIKECLTFMLRCLKDPKTVEWDNIMSDALECGLITVDEAAAYQETDPLKKEEFFELIRRMLNKNRFFYIEYYNVVNGKMGGFLEKYDKTNGIKYFEYLGQLLEMGLHI